MILVYQSRQKVTVFARQLWKKDHDFHQSVASERNRFFNELFSGKNNSSAISQLVLQS